MGLSGYHYPVHGVVFAPRTALVGLLSGTAVTALAALLPARRATMAAPVSTIADPGATRAMVPGWARRRVVVGLSGGVLGLVFLAGAVAGGFGPPLLLVALGVIALIGGISALNPVIVRPAVRTIASPLVRIGGQTAALGRDNALRNPRRTSATATALMIGIGLVGVVAILGASMKASATQTLRTSLRADFVVSPKGVGAAANGVPPAAAEALRTTPGVAVVSEVRAGQFGLDGTATQLVAVDPATVTATHALDAKSVAAAQALGHGGVLVRNTEASAKGWKVGDEVPMTFARTGPQRLRLAAVFSTTTVRSDYVVSLDTFQANFNQQLDAEVDVRLAAGEAPSSARTRVEAVLRDFPGAEVMNKAQAVGAQQAKVDQVLLPVTAVLALSVLIALLGIANTLALSIHERTHEIGMLRAIGMAKRQLRSMIRSEAAIIALLGSLLGAAVAVLFGWAPVASMRDLGVTQLVVPVRQLAAIVAGATVAGLAAGVLPARRAASLPVLEAMRADQPW
jgi:putative ABC transport system permease protein